MAFHFTLEAVLRYRQSLEEREQLHLQKLLAERTALLQQLQESGDRRRQLQTAMGRSLELASVAAAELHFAGYQLHAIEVLQESLRAALIKLQNEILQQTARYRQQRQKHEALESLRELQWQDYRITQQRREQAMLDELHLLRRARRSAQFAQSTRQALPSEASPAARGPLPS